MKGRIILIALFACSTAIADQTADIRLLTERLRPLLAPDYRVTAGLVDGGVPGVEVQAEDSYRKRVPFVVHVEIAFSQHLDEVEWLARYRASERARKRLIDTHFAKDAVAEFNATQFVYMPDGTFGGSCVEIIGHIEPVPTDTTMKAAVTEAQRVHDKIILFVHFFKTPNHASESVAPSVTPPAGQEARQP